MRLIRGFLRYFSRHDCKLCIIFYSLLFIVFHFYRTNVNNSIQLLKFSSCIEILYYCYLLFILYISYPMVRCSFIFSYCQFCSDQSFSILDKQSTHTAFPLKHYALFISFIHFNYSRRVTLQHKLAFKGPFNKIYNHTCCNTC